MGSYSRLAVRVRRRLLKCITGLSLEGLVVRANVYITYPRKLNIGRDVSINHNCILLCEGGLEIGDYVSIAHNTSIITTEYSYTDLNIPIKFQPIQHLPVRIGSDVWIGSRVSILAGISIASGSVIAAGSVVTRDILDENTIVGGVPARFIKKRL